MHEDVASGLDGGQYRLPRHERAGLVSNKGPRVARQVQYVAGLEVDDREAGERGRFNVPEGSHQSVAREVGQANDAPLRDAHKTGETAALVHTGMGWKSNRILGFCVVDGA